MSYLAFIKRKLQQIESLIGNDEYKATLTVQGSEQEKQFDIVDYVTEDTILRSFPVRGYPSANVIELDSGFESFPIGYWNSVTKILIDGSDSSDGTYTVQNIDDTNFGVVSVTVSESVTPSSSILGTGYLIYPYAVLRSNSYLPGIQNTTIEIIGSATLDGRYYCVYIGWDGTYFTYGMINSLPYTEADNTTPGAIYNLAQPENLAVNHQLNSLFLVIYMYYQNNTILVSSFSLTDANNIAIDAWSYGFTIGEEVTVYIKKLGSSS